MALAINKSWDKIKDTELLTMMTILSKIRTKPVGLVDTTRTAGAATAGEITITITISTKISTILNSMVGTVVNPTVWAITVIILTSVVDMALVVWEILTECNKECIREASKTMTTRERKVDVVRTPLYNSISKAPRTKSPNRALGFRGKALIPPRRVGPVAGRTIKLVDGVAVLQAGKATTRR